jgi:hypothetical protein
VPELITQPDIASQEAFAEPGVSERSERMARDELRRQIAGLEQRLGELWASAFPRKGIDWSVGAIGGPRVLGVADLERLRDALVTRVGEASAELSRRAEVEEANRSLVESMIAEPDRYRWVRVSGEDVGEPGCRHWHSKPRWGIIGMLRGWWHVKLSSGCPLALGRGPAASREFKEEAKEARQAQAGWRAVDGSAC